MEARSEADLNPWPAPFDQPFYLLMNVAVGGNFPGHPDQHTRMRGRSSADGPSQGPPLASLSAVAGR